MTCDGKLVFSLIVFQFSSLLLVSFIALILPLILAVKNNVDSEAAFEAVETVAGFEEVDGNN